MKGITVTVSQLNRYIKAVLDEDAKLRGIFVRGEISNFVHHARSGHLYFTLKDRDSAVRAVMFQSYAGDLRFRPESGMAVLVQANVGVFERDGVYQLYVTDMQPDGVGALAVAFEQVKARLAEEGLFDEGRKKPLPSYPRRIGVVTSESGAALQDIVNVLSRRYPLGELVLSPAPVQGKEAPAALIRALEALDRRGNCDVIIIGRGGGSAEDLAAFNDEGLARAVFGARIPVVSAVGHETDYTICDFVADVRAPTPSAAAELAAPPAELLRRQTESARIMLRRVMIRQVEEWEELLRRIASSRPLRTPYAYLLKNQERLDFLTDTLYTKKDSLLRGHADSLGRRAALLDSLSPLRILDRGYCMALGREEDKPVFAGDLQVGDRVALRFRDGTASARVEAVHLAESREGGTSDGGEEKHDL